MAHPSQFESAIQAVEATATPLKSGQSPAQSTSVLGTQRFQPHTKPQSVISGWTWAIFMTSTTLLLGSIFFASFTKTAAIPQLPTSLPSAISGWNAAPK
ncbi:MAG: hypothetical protein HC895_25155 [Leptolyngbyaceae cyanobacterium SM1_3_5]|nr:hypothetical protein [Leptolyngbyaceae cyanobacterium SM1_3_5]